MAQRMPDRQVLSDNLTDPEGRALSLAFLYRQLDKSLFDVITEELDIYHK